MTETADKSEGSTTVVGESGSSPTKSNDAKIMDGDGIT